MSSILKDFLRNSAAKYYLFDASYILLMIIYIIIFSVWLNRSEVQIQQISDDPINYQSQQLFEQWKQPMIEDVAIQIGVQCPTNYSSLNLYKWSGSLTGCSCSYDITQPTLKIVINQTCSQKLLSDFGCQDVESTLEQQFNGWRGQGLCIKNSSESMYNENAQLCKQKNGKYCGSGDAGICIAKDTQCPINFVTITTETLPLKYLSLNDNETMYISSINDKLNFPIIQFKVDEYKLCDGDKQNISPGSKDYTLKSIQRSVCQQNNEWNLIDEINEQEFYNSNPTLNQLTSNLPVYPSPSSYVNYQLGYKVYPYWSGTCRNLSKLTVQQFEQSISLTKENEVQKKIIITTIITLVLIFGSVISYLYTTIENFNKDRKQNYQIKNLTLDESNYKLNLSLKQYNFPVSLQVGSFNQIETTGLMMVNKNFNKYQKVIRYKCAPLQNSLFKQYQDDYFKLYEIYVNMFIFCLSIIIFDLFLLAFQVKYYIGKKGPSIKSNFFHRPIESEQFHSKTHQNLGDNDETRKMNEQQGLDNSHYNTNLPPLIIKDSNEQSIFQKLKDTNPIDAVQQHDLL